MFFRNCLFHVFSEGLLKHNLEGVAKFLLKITTNEDLENGINATIDQHQVLTNDINNGKHFLITPTSPKYSKKHTKIIRKPADEECDDNG